MGAKKAAAAARTAAEAMADLAEPEEEAAVCKRDAAQDRSQLGCGGTEEAQEEVT